MNVEIFNDINREDLNYMINAYENFKLDELTVLGKGMFGVVYGYKNYAIKVYYNDSSNRDADIMKDIHNLDCIPNLHAVLNDSIMITERIFGKTVAEYCATEPRNILNLDEEIISDWENSLASVIESGYLPLDLHGNNVMICMRTSKIKIVDVGEFTRYNRDDENIKDNIGHRMINTSVGIVLKNYIENMKQKYEYEVWINMTLIAEVSEMGIDIENVDLDVEVFNKMHNDDLLHIIKLYHEHGFDELEILGEGTYGIVYEYYGFAIKKIYDKYNTRDADILRDLHHLDCLPKLYAIINDEIIVSEKINGRTVGYYYDKGLKFDVSETIVDDWENALFKIIEEGYTPNDLHDENVMICEKSGDVIIIDVGCFYKHNSDYHSDKDFMRKNDGFMMANDFTGVYLRRLVGA